MGPCKRAAALDKNDELGATLHEIEYLRPKIRAKVEHPFRVIKRQCCVVKVRYAA
jgi:IS5 family transposase